MLKKLIEHMIKQLANKPNDVNVKLTQTNEKDAYTIYVAEEDRGKVIGRDGKTIKALRSVVYVLSPEDKNISIEIA